MGVHAHTGATGSQVAADPAGVGAEVEFRILGVDPALNGVAPQLDVRLAEGEGIALGHLDLLGDQVQAGDHLCHGMLHLDAGVHLHEVEVAALVDQELDRPGADVVDRFGGQHGGIAHALTQISGQGRAGSFLQQLLVTALDRAVALAQVNDVAVAVGDDLELDVAGPLDEFLDVEAGVAEGSFRFALGRQEQLLEVTGLLDQSHAASATPGGGLDHHWVADLGGEAGRLLDVGDQTVTAGHGGNAHPLHRLLGSGLVAHGPDGLWGGADEGNLVVGADLGEAGVLRQEAVAGVDGAGVVGQGRGDDVGDVQVALAAGRFTDADGFVCQLHVQGVAVHGGVDGDGADPQLFTGPQDPQRDFAPVGNQDLGKTHALGSLRQPSQARFAARTDIESYHAAPRPLPSPGGMR